MPMSMSMTLKFKTVAQFFFMNWQTETVGGLVLGCFCCMVLAFIMMTLPSIRKKMIILFQNHEEIIQNSKSRAIDQKLLEKKQKNRKQQIILLSIYLIHAFLHVVLMVIIMNMNFYVILSIIIGASLGYFATFSNECSRKDHKCCQQIMHGEMTSVANRTDQFEK